MKINIAYSCDELYVQHTGISILSLLENNKNFEEINIYFIEKNVSQNSLILLKKIVKSFNRNLIIIPFWKLCSKLKINSLGRHIETVYSKLFFSGIKGVDKILYIDSDTIINETLIDFWKIDLINYWVAGVATFTVDSKKSLGLERKDVFINDGVVLLNLKAIREQNVENDFIDCIASYNGDPPVLSEGVINKVCKGKIKVIHPRYNLMSGLIKYKHNPFLNLDNYYTKKVIRDAVAKPVIIHFLSAFFNRPWDVNCSHPYKDEYLYYKNLSPWKDNSLENNKLKIRLRIIKRLYQIFPSILINFFRNLKK